MNYYQNELLSPIARTVRFIGIFLIMMLPIILIIPIQSSGLGDVRAKVVTNVSGLQNYELHWNDRFPPGSTLMIYAEADDINHRRLVGVDYIFIIKDSNDNTVNWTVIKSRYEDYRSNDFIQYQEKIDENLEDGTYVAEIHIFDLLNDSLVENYYNDLTKSLLNEENDDEDDHHYRDYRDYLDNHDKYDNEEEDDIPDIPYLNRSEIMNNADLMAHQYKKIVQPFYVDKYAMKYPVNRFTIDNMSLGMNDIAPGVPIQINVSVMNTFNDKGKVSLELLLDNRTIDNVTSDIDPYTTKNITFNIPTEVTSLLDYGNHTIEIIPTSDNSVGLDLSTILQIIQTEVEIPAKFYYSDIQINKLRAEPNETVIVTVKVENRGRAGNQSIGLLINDIPVEEKIIYVNSLEKKDVNFSITEKESGEYRVTVNNSMLSKMFFVETAGEVAQQQSVVVEERQLPKIIIILGLSSLVILIYIIRKKFITRLLSEIKK